MIKPLKRKKTNQEEIIEVVEEGKPKKLKKLIKKRC